MIRRITSWTLAAFALLALGAGCAQKNPACEKALRDFDTLGNAECPSEAKSLIARNLGLKSDDVRIIHYGPTGEPTATSYFAALGRNGKLLAGVYEEAQARVARTDYNAAFAPEDFVWAVKIIRNDPPFADRTVRYERACPTEILRGPKHITVRYADGWLVTKQKWSTGEIKINLDGTQILDEIHANEYAFNPMPTPPNAKTTAGTGTAATAAGGNGPR
jgi:hypothetical protein